MRAVVGGIMTLLAVIGIAGFKEDMETWGDWLGSLGSSVVYGAVYGLLLVIGLALLATERYRRPDRRDVDIPIRRPEPEDEPESASVAAVPPVPAPDRSRPAETAQPDPSELRSSRRPNLSDRLQARLDEGYALRRRIPAMPRMAITGLFRPETTEADVTMWIKRTERMLREAGEPELLSEFRYRPGKAILASLGCRTILAPPAYADDLDRRVANLKGIIQALRDAGR